MGGMTEANDGVSFGFQGNYSATAGFLGEITKIDNGAVSGVNWGDKSIHGTISGTLNANDTITLSAAPLPVFQDYLLGPLTVDGEGRFLDPAKKTVARSLALHYCGQDLPSTILAAKEVN